MPSNDPAQRLSDILENVQRIHSYTKGMNQASFIRDHKTVDAVERCFQRITEAVTKLGDVYDTTYPDLDLAALRGFCNVLRHDYDAIQAELLWGFVEDRLKPLDDMARAELDRL